MHKSEITIEVTLFCPFECPICSSDASLNGKPLKFDDIESFLRKNLPPSGIYDRIDLSGGEPLSHPDIWKILNLCHKIAKKVRLYSNAIDEWAFNTTIIKNAKFIANVPLAPNVDIHIPSPEDLEIHVLKFIPQGRGKKLQPLNIHFSSNITNPEKCNSCTNITLKGDGTVAKSPCRKDDIIG